MLKGKGQVAAFAGLYLLVAGICLGPLFAVGGLSDTSFGIALVTGVALLPITAMLYPLIARLAARRTPPPAAAQPVAQATAPRPGRQDFEFAFAAWNGIDSIEAVERLSARLTMLGIEHRFARAISVRDGDVRWEVAPVTGALRITGWVEGPDADQRMLVMAAIEEFLIDELGIRLEKLAA
jgi:hypothetical protein